MGLDQGIIYCCYYQILEKFQIIQGFWVYVDRLDCLLSCHDYFDYTTACTTVNCEALQLLLDLL